MIRDEDLKSSIDYSEGQKEAAHRILVELVNIFKEYEEDIRIVGGWVPDLMFPGEGHIGSVDVDVLINHLTLQDEGYQNMSRILQSCGYREHPDKYFSFVKTVEIEGISYDVDVDILAGMYGGTQQKRRSQHVQGIKALKATGGNFAFDFPAQKIHVEAKRPDGALDVANELAKEFQPAEDKKLVQEMKEKLAGKFASADHAGPKDVADFLELSDDEDMAMIKRDAYEQVQALLNLISN